MAHVSIRIPNSPTHPPQALSHGSTLAGAAYKKPCSPILSYHTCSRLTSRHRDVGCAPYVMHPHLRVRVPGQAPPPIPVFRPPGSHAPAMACARYAM